MFRFISAASTAAALALSVSLAAPAQAGPITTLGECYTAVINWCTETFPEHAGECGQSSGLDDCDEEFGNASVSRAGYAVNRTGPAMPSRAFQRLINGATLMRVSR